MMSLVLLGLVTQLLLATGCNDTPALDKYELGGDFVLTDEQGRPFQLSQHSKGVRLLFFGFTSCPDVCPTTMSRLGQVLAALPAPGAQVLLVSVDPVHDTPDQLAQYVAGWDFPLRALTGTVEQIRAVVAAYGASFQPAEGAGVDRTAGVDRSAGVDHSARVYLLDGSSQVRYLFSVDDPVQRIIDVTESLLVEETES